MLDSISPHFYIRFQIITTLLRNFQRRLHIDVRELFDICLAIEYECFEKFTKRAKCECYWLYENMKIYSEMLYDIFANEDAVCKLIRESSDKLAIAKKLPYMKYYEIDPEKTASQMIQFNTRKNQKIKYKESETYNCTKCRSKKVITEVVQRSIGLDESASIQVTCTECGHIFHN